MIPKYIYNLYTYDVFLFRICENPISNCPSAITKDQTGIIILRDLNVCLAIEKGTKIFFISKLYQWY